jgi:hypothetical protein
MASASTSRPCAQCQGRHLSCDRQRPCKRCVETGPALALACCDPVDIPKKRGRPPGASKRNNTSSSSATSPHPVLYPAPKRQCLMPVLPLPSGINPTIAPIPPQPSITAQHPQSPPSASLVGEDRSERDADVMQAVLHELRHLRSAFTTLSEQVATLTRRQNATDGRLDALPSSTVSFPLLPSPARPPVAVTTSAASLIGWHDMAKIVNAITHNTPLSQPSQPTVWPGHYQHQSSAVPSFFPFDSPPSSSSSSSSPKSFSSVPSPPLPPTVSMQAFDARNPRVLAVLPNNQLSSSFDLPWVIEHMVNDSDARLPKHQFPTPDLYQYYGTKRPLTAAANEQFRALTRYSWVRALASFFFFFSFFELILKLSKRF